MSARTSSTRMRRTHRTLLLSIGSAVASLSLAACSSVASTGATGGDSGKAVVDVPYSGAEAGLPNSYPRPTKKDGQAFRVGYLNPFAGLANLKAEQDAAEAAVTALGGTLIAKDANTDANLQVTQCQELLTQGVDAIVGYPMNPESWSSCVADATAKGVPVSVLGAPWDFSKPAPEGFTAMIGQAYDDQAYQTAKAVAQDKPGASFAVLCTGLPIPSLTYWCGREEYWGKKFGLKYLGRVDAASDSPEGGATATTDILAKYPTVDAVFTYDVAVGVAAGNLAKPKIVTVACGGTKADVQSLKNGGVKYTYILPWDDLGTQVVYAAYDKLTGQGGGLPRLANITGRVYDKSTIGDLGGV